MNPSPNPMLTDMQNQLRGITLGVSFDEEQLQPILSNEAILGVDLYECGMADPVTAYFLRN